MGLHVEEVSVDSNDVRIEFVSQFDDERWEELESRGVVFPESDAVLIWYDELVMFSGSYARLQALATKLGDLLT